MFQNYYRLFFLTLSIIYFCTFQSCEFTLITIDFQTSIINLFMNQKPLIPLKVIQFLTQEQAFEKYCFKLQLPIL